MRLSRLALKKWILWSNPNDSIKKISIKRTIQVHLLLFIVLTLGSTSFYSRPKIQRMKLRTSVEKIVATKRAPPVKKKVPSPAKPAQKKRQPQPTEAKKETKTLKKQETLNSLEKKLEAIESRLRDAANAPKIELIQPETFSKTPSNLDPYAAELIAYFRELIRLPEQDQVVATITVQPNGEIVRIESIFSESKLNVRVVETKILRAKLPPFEGTDLKTLTFVFCEE